MAQLFGRKEIIGGTEILPVEMAKMTDENQRPEIFLISFSLFSASMGVRLLISR